MAMMRPDAPSDTSAKVMTFSCEEHGELYEVVVHCQHDSEDESRRVVGAHRASYGANCNAMVTVKLLDRATGDEVQRSQSRVV